MTDIIFDFFRDWKFAVSFILLVTLGGVFIYFQLLYTLEVGLSFIGIFAYIINALRSFIDALRGRPPLREEEKKDNIEEEMKDK